MSEQEKGTEASMRISWILAKHTKPFTDADIIKECMVEAGNALFDSKNDIMETINTYLLTCVKVIETVWTAQSLVSFKTDPHRNKLVTPGL